MLNRTMKLSVTLVVAIAACKSSADQQSSGAAAAASTVADRGNDPCTYLAASEAEAYVGPLLTPPFRFDESMGAPDADGTHCMYRGRNGREIMVDVIAGGARMEAAITAGVPGAVGRMLEGTGHADLQEVPAALTKQGEKGPWDNSQWMPVTGTLQAVKGDSGLSIDVAASNAGEQGAYVLAREALPRLGKPLEYDGAHAAALAPKPRAPLANPCDLIPRARVEQAIGSLSGAPERDSSATQCTYRAASTDGTQEYQLDITWVNGTREFAHMKSSIGSAATALGMPGGGSPTVPPESQKMVQQMLGQITKMSGGTLGAPGLMHPASDSSLTGPWDAAGLIAGGLVATKHNVMVQLPLTPTSNYDKAKALLAAACEQL